MASLTRLFTTIDEAMRRPGAKAPCADQDPGLWFSENWQDIERAKRLCRACPVRQACLDGAVERRETGVWGGQLLDRGHLSKRSALRRSTS